MDSEQSPEQGIRYKRIVKAVGWSRHVVMWVPEGTSETPFADRLRRLGSFVRATVAASRERYNVPQPNQFNEDNPAWELDRAIDHSQTMHKFVEELQQTGVVDYMLQTQQTKSASQHDH